MAYLDLTDSKTYEAITEALTQLGASAEVVAFAFDSYGCNEDTLDHIEYYYWIDHADVLQYAGIDDEEDEED